nr:hypothetical protein Iba_chr15dCG1990 [Ipomoea batatas]
MKTAIQLRDDTSAKPHSTWTVAGADNPRIPSSGDGDSAIFSPWKLSAELNAGEFQWPRNRLRRFLSFLSVAGESQGVKRKEQASDRLLRRRRNSR